MFLVILTYKKPLEEIEQYLSEHISFLDKYYEKKKFVFSGRQNPRTGGIILVKSDNRDEIMQIVKEDPFNVHDLADYEAIHFTPTKYDPLFGVFIE